MPIVVAYEDLRGLVCRANVELGESGLVVLTWGNVSAIDRDEGVFAIKPSGVGYTNLTPDMIPVIRLDSGIIVAGALKPSSDTPTHRELYLSFESVGGIVHTHSEYATAWAQARKPIPCMGTTHADYFAENIPVTRNLSSKEIDEGYEAATGRVVVEHFRENALDPRTTPGALLPHHGPFTWGATASEALRNAIVLEAVAKMAYFTRSLSPDGDAAPENLVRKHFERKHGPKAYYGQE